MRIGLARTHLIAFGAAAVLWTVMFAINSGQPTPSAASADVRETTRTATTRPASDSGAQLD